MVRFFRGLNLSVGMDCCKLIYDAQGFAFVCLKVSAEARGRYDSENAIIRGDISSCMFM